MDTVTAEQIAERLALPVRQVRYVLEHGVVPGAERRSRGHRVTRHFTPLEGFGIALAAVLLAAGIRRPVVALLLEAMVRPHLSSSGRRTTPLEDALAAGSGPASACWIELADQVNWRLDRGDAAAWRQLATGQALARSYRPLVVVRVDAARLAAASKG